MKEESGRVSEDALEPNRLSSKPQEAEGIAKVIRADGFGGWVARKLRKLCLHLHPAIALGNRRIYSVTIEGGGFELPLDGPDASQTGFYTVLFVAASTPEEAEARAKQRILDDWRGLSLMSHFTGNDTPTLSRTECRPVAGRFRLKSATGYIFFENSSDMPGETGKPTRKHGFVP